MKLNRRDHIPRDHNRRLPPKSNSQSPSKPRKSNLKESTNENKSSSSRAGNHRSSMRTSNQYEVVMSRRQARVLDRWAAQQARTIERQKHCKYDISDSDYESLSSRTPSRDPSPAASDSSVSSLVKKWREFEVSNTTTSRRHGQRESSFTGCSAVVSRTSSMASSFSEQESNSTSTWDVDCSQGGGGGERVRVVDIIKMLPLLECGDATTLCSNAVLASPRIRGRQAVSDLLAKLEHDRYSEIKATSKRQAVSNFPRRAFLQSMLKLRLLRLEVAAQDQPLQRPNSIQVQLLEKCESSSSVNNNQRERINPAIAECFDFIKTRHTEIDKLISNLVTREICTSNQEPQSTQAIEKKHQGETSSAQINNVDYQVSHRGKDQGTSKTSFRSSSIHEKLTMQEAAEKVNAQPNAAWPKMTSKYSNEIVDCISRETKNTPPYEQENEQHMTCQDEQIKEDVCDSYALYGTNLEWINDVSRPRSYWESLRQAWYQEVFTTSSKHEIRQLIERGSVATVLASDFRERMDRILMMSSSIQERAQRIGYDITEGERHSSCAIQMQRWSNQLDEEQEGQEVVSVEEEATENVEEIREERKQQVQGQKNVELERLSFHQSNNRGYYYEQGHEAPWPHLGWRKYNNQEDSDNSEQFGQERDTQGEGGCSLKNSSSIEMELIYDLRAHMEREMRELRMWQNKLQSSIRDEVSAVLGLQPGSQKGKGKGKGKGKRNESNGKAPNKGCCCICYQNKVDSVLYRCGHMCAHELRRSSGKCPICRARMVDVVRVFNHA